MSIANHSTEDSLRETISLLTGISKLMAGALQDLDGVLQREAAGEIRPAEALATLRAILERHYGEGGSAH